MAGYSEGGFCAANIGLQEPSRYGAAGVISGYFAPILSQVPAGNKPGGKRVVVNVFAGHPAQQLILTPVEDVTRVPINQFLPACWLAAGALDKADVSGAANVRQLLQTRRANVPLKVIPGGGHQGSVWRAALGPMLNWMTPQLAEQAAEADAAAAAGPSDLRAPHPHAPGPALTAAPPAKR